MKIIYTDVLFEGGYPQVSQWVPLADAPAYFIEHQAHLIQKVRWHYEGQTEIHESFAKQWMTWTGEKHELARIGAGAYGDSIVARYDETVRRYVNPDHSARRI